MARESSENEDEDDDEEDPVVVEEEDEEEERDREDLKLCRGDGVDLANTWNRKIGFIAEGNHKSWLALVIRD